MHIRSFCVSIAAAFALLAVPAGAQSLPRAASLLVGSGAVPAEVQSAAGGVSGLYVATVIPGGTAQAIGVAPGDYLTRINGQPISTPSAAVAAVKAVPPGETLTVNLLRNGQWTMLSGPAVPMPLESYGDAFVEYGAVPFEGGLLRDIYTAPSADFSGPVMFFIQGYTCGSMESVNPRGPIREMVAAMLARNIAVYRVEKPGVGDSTGPAKCSETGYDIELRAFQAAYRHLLEVRRVPAERIVIFGHSLGGIEAPMVASTAEPPRGVAVYGTILRGWSDYIFDMVRLQNLWLAGADPVETASVAEMVRDSLRAFHLGTENPRVFAAADPVNERALTLIGWTGGDDVAARHHSYWQELSRVSLHAPWRDTRSHVLSLYGDADFEVLNDEDQRQIAEHVNYYRPGTARFVLVPDTGHVFEAEGSREEIIQTVRRTGRPWQRPSPPRFNSEIGRITADWIDEIMAKPPVAEE